MSKLSPQRFTLEEFQDQRDWIGKLFSPLNKFIQETVQALTNSLTIEDNLYQEIKEIKWVNNSGNLPLKFRTKFPVPPRGLFPIYLYNNTLDSYSVLAPWVVSSYANGEVTISEVVGLTTGSSYTMRLLVIYK